MKPRAGQNQIRSPCPRALRAPARPHVRLSDTTRTGRAAEDVGPYHPSCPDAARRAKYPRRPRRGTFEQARRGTSPSGRAQFIATGTGRHPAGQHGARGDTKARRRLRVDLRAHQSWTA